jgi:hypothetical protein
MVDLGQLVPYHLLGYSLETVSNEEHDEEGEDRRIDVGNDPRMGNGEGEERMEDVLSRFVRRECRASSLIVPITRL